MTNVKIVPLCSLNAFIKLENLDLNHAYLTSNAIYCTFSTNLAETDKKKITFSGILIYYRFQYKSLCQYEQSNPIFHTFIISLS